MLTNIRMRDLLVGSAHGLETGVTGNMRLIKGVTTRCSGIKGMLPQENLKILQIHFEVE